MMGRFFNGMVVGATIALLVAPVRGEEMRRLVRERIDKLSETLPSSTTREQPEPEALSEVKENVRESVTRPDTKVMGQTKPNPKVTGQTKPGSTNT
jgi:gas vesicle protein